MNIVRWARGETQDIPTPHLSTPTLLPTGRTTRPPAPLTVSLSSDFQWTDSVSATEETATFQHASDNWAGRHL